MKSRLSTCLVFLCLAGLGSCRQAQIGSTSEGRVLPSSSQPALAEEKLSALGLEVAWDLPLPGEQLLGLYQLPDAPRDKPEEGEPRRGMLVAYTNKSNLYGIGLDGNVRWVFGLTEQLRYPPTIYWYERTPGIRGSDDEVLFVEGSVLHALDTSGNELWKTRLDFTPTTSPVANHTHIFVGAADHRVYRIGKKSHYRDWHWLTDGPVTAPCEVSPQTLFFGSEDGTIYAFSLDQKGVEPRGRFITEGPVRHAPIFHLSVLYGVSDDRYVYAIDSIQAPPTWKFATGAPITRSVVPIRNSIYVSAGARRGSGTGPAQRGTLFALNRINKVNPESNQLIPAGSVKWQFPDGAQVLARGRNHLYFLNVDGDLCCVLEETGELVWKDDFTRQAAVFVTNARDPADRYTYIAGNGGVMYVGYGAGWVLALREKKRL